MTVTLQADDGRDTLRFERHLAHSPERVWRAITDPGELEAWFPSAVAYEQRLGAPIEFDFRPRGHDIVFGGEVLAWDPPHLFACTWGVDQLRFELTPDGDGTLLVFTHAFAHEPGKPARDGAGWTVCFERLDALVDRDDTPGSPDRWRVLHEELLGRFGQLSVVSEDGGGERGVRLTGPLRELDGRPAVNVEADDGRRGVMVVAEGGAFADGAEVEVLAGSLEEPGERIAAGTLRDPLASARAVRA